MTIGGDRGISRAMMDPEGSNPSSDAWSDWLLTRRHGGDPKYEAVVRGSIEGMRNHVLDGAKVRPGMVLVDVGAGDGLIAFGAFERVASKLSAVLVDVSAPLLKRAEKLAVEYGVRDRCVFLQTSAEGLDGIADESADVITTRAVLAYVADKDAATRQFYRVLRPGGRVSIGEPINRNAAVKLAALTDLLNARPVDASNIDARLLQRVRAAQLPSTVAAIKNNPFTNFSERDLIGVFQRAGFNEIHLELHIDLRKSSPMSWNTYIDIAPRPGTPTLREIFQAQFSPAERDQFERSMRSSVESGQLTEQETVAYLTAVKPSE